MRVFVTGVGVVSPLARDAASTFARLCAGDRAIAPLTLFSMDESRSNVAAECAGIDVAAIAPLGEAETFSRTDAMATLAVREALADARVDPRDAPVDLVVGGTTAGMFETEAILARLSRDPEAITPLKLMLSHPLSSTADHVAAVAGPFRWVRTVCSACSSAACAIALGASWVRAGRADVVVAGGAEGLCRLTYAGFASLAALDLGACRPFDRRRKGLNLGEGAGFVVLESEARAKARGRAPLAELAGCSIGAEAHHITNPEASGLTAARVMREAIAAAGLELGDIDYVNAHGTATPLNDSMESAAIHGCFGPEGAARVRVSTVKGQIGHTLGAAGGIEAAVTALAIAKGMLPPTIGLDEVDPACALGHVVRATPARVRAALSNSFGFGGTDAVLALTEPEAFAEPRAPRRRTLVATAAATVGPLGVQPASGTAAYLEPGAPPPPAPLDVQLSAHLDVGRARRLDRAGRLTTIAVERALRDANVAVGHERGAGLRVGAVVGAAFGSVDGSTAYMRRVYDKGARFAPPAEFPNLVPSSPVGHASIYLGLRGPVLATADLGATPESAIFAAADLLEAGLADVMAAGSVEEASPMIERCLGPVCSQIDGARVRSEGASVVVLEAEDLARARGARAIARVVHRVAWRGSPVDALAQLPPPSSPERALVLLGRDEPRTRAALVGSAWAGVRVVVVEARAGGHEGAGGFAIAAAVGAIDVGSVDAALCVGSAPERGYAIVLARGAGAEAEAEAEAEVEVA